VDNLNTDPLDGKRAFEERVFARFDAVDLSIRSLDSRLQRLEIRDYDTKPIWERALKEIAETKEELKEVRNELKAEVNELRGEVKELRGEVNELRGEVNELRGEVRGLTRELKETRRELTRRLDQLGAVILENHAGLGDLEDRIEKLESEPPK
jgi:chromosome segregation ATPase